MQAIHLVAYGDPAKALTAVEIPEPPSPGPGEVLVQVEYSPLNTSDLLLAKGQYVSQPKLPAVVGNEAAGVVIEVGDGVASLKIGDRVLVSRKPFAWAERLLAQESDLFLLPANIDLLQASMLSINTATASMLLSRIVALKPGSWVVQNAGNSGVGRSVIAIAKSRGIRTISLVRRADLIDELEAAGGDVVLLDTKTAPEQAARATGGAPVILGLDGVGGPVSALLGAIVTENAVIVNYAAMTGLPMAINPFDLIMKKLLVRGFFMYHPEFLPHIEEAIAEGASLVVSGDLHVPVAGLYGFSDIKQAVAHVVSGGKVILDASASAPLPEHIHGHKRRIKPLINF